MDVAGCALDDGRDGTLAEPGAVANEWYVRQARTLLQERGGNPKVHEALKKILYDNPDVTRKLRALWTLHATNGLMEKAGP